MNQRRKAVIFDWMRTLFDPTTGALVPGVRETLRVARDRGYFLVVLTRREGDREQLIGSLLGRSLIDDVVIVDRKSADELRKYFDEKRIDPASSYMVGDRVRDEIVIGNRLGIQTVWVRIGKFSTEVPRDKTEMPMKTITVLTDLRLVLK